MDPEVSIVVVCVVVSVILYRLRFLGGSSGLSFSLRGKQALTMAVSRDKMDSINESMYFYILVTVLLVL